MKPPGRLLRSATLSIGVVIIGLAASISSDGYSPTAVPSRSPTPLPALGAHFHALWSDYTDDERRVVLDKLAAAGVRWIAIDVGWAAVESVPGRLSQWQINRLSRAVNLARARGLKVEVMLWRTPSWANGGLSPEVAPLSADGFGRFAGMLAARFKGRVSAWQIWAEPNSPHAFTGSADDYVELLRASYPRIKAADPKALVVLGAPSLNDVSWLEGVYAAGASPYFDVMATNPYLVPADAPPETPDDGTPGSISAVARVKQLMDAQGDGDKPVWFTEYGWSAHVNTGIEEAAKRGVTPEQQADYLVRSVRYVAERYPYVKTMIWYASRDTVTGDTHNDSFGLLTHGLSEKPAYRALKALLVDSRAARTEQRG
jgi:hypothetical protein